MSYAIDRLELSRCLSPGAILDNTSPTTYTVDTLGCDHVALLVFLGATDIAMAAFKVQESDTLSSATALSTGTDVSGGDFSVSPATLPSATDDDKFFLVKIPITGARKRYLDVTITAGDGSAGSYITGCWLKQPKIKPSTAATAGCSQVLSVAG